MSENASAQQELILRPNFIHSFFAYAILFFAWGIAVWWVYSDLTDPSRPSGWTNTFFASPLFWFWTIGFLGVFLTLKYQSVVFGHETVTAKCWYKKTKIFPYTDIASVDFIVKGGIVIYLKNRQKVSIPDFLLNYFPDRRLSGLDVVRKLEEKCGDRLLINDRLF